MIDVSAVDLDELAMALADQAGFEHRWLIDPDNGQIWLWTEDGGIDGEHPVDLDEVDLIGIHPVPSHVWYQDMADFADGISDEPAGRRLARAIRGKGAFGRFKDELNEEYPQLLPAWYAFRDARAQRRAVDGSSTTTSSIRHRPRSSSPSIPNRTCHRLPHLQEEPLSRDRPPGRTPSSSRSEPARIRALLPLLPRMVRRLLVGSAVALPAQKLGETGSVINALRRRLRPS